MIDAYEEEHPDYVSYLEKDIWDEKTYMDSRPTDKNKFTVKLKKGQTYIFAIDNSGMTTLGKLTTMTSIILIRSPACMVAITPRHIPSIWRSN